jgi:amidophosphoribosyltransferase
VATLIDADEVIYQNLEDLKAACMEAASSRSEVKDFEVGVFCGTYRTKIPEDYMVHLSRQQRNKRRKLASVPENGEQTSAVLVANGGPVNTRKQPDEADTNGVKPPENQEDVR